jgi:hypothetical protein
MCTPSRRLLSRTFKFASSAGAIAAVLALAVTAGAGEKRNDEMFSLQTVIPIPGNPAGTNLVSFDISWVDPVLHLYYLGDRSNKAVDVIDTSTTPPTFKTQFKQAFVGVDPRGNDFSGPDGVVTVDHKEVWVGDGKSRVWVLDAKTGDLVDTHGASNPIPTSLNNDHRADELCYDSADHLVLVANNADVPPFASIISTQTYTVVPGGKIVFDGTNGVPAADGIEQCQWSPRTGKFYISLPQLTGKDPGVGAVAVIDPKTKKVVNLFPIPVEDCAAPQGMSIGPDPQIVLGCNAQSPPNGVFNTVIINEHSGHVIATLANEGGDDEVWFNPGDGHYFLAGGSFLPNEQLGIVDSRFKTQDQTIQTGNPHGTARRAHSVAADLNTNLVYLPIPGTGGGGSLMPPTVGFQSSICGDTTALQQAGCVAVFGVTNDPRPNVARERGPDDKQE